MPPTLLADSLALMATGLAAVKRIGALEQRCPTQLIRIIRFGYRGVRELTREPIIAMTCMGFLGNTALAVACNFLFIGLLVNL